MSCVVCLLSVDLRQENLPLGQLTLQADTEIEYEIQDGGFASRSLSITKTDRPDASNENPEDTVLGPSSKP